MNKKIILVFISLTFTFLITSMTVGGFLLIRSAIRHQEINLKDSLIRKTELFRYLVQDNLLIGNISEVQRQLEKYKAGEHFFSYGIIQESNIIAELSCPQEDFFKTQSKIYFSENDKDHSWGYLEICYSLKEIKYSKLKLTNNLIASLTFVSFLILLIFIILIRMLFKVVKDLEKDISVFMLEKISTFDFKKNRWDVLGPLRLAFTKSLTEKLELKDKIKENEKSVAIATIAAQVSHDIRSPLSALDMAVKDIGELPEDTRLIIRHSMTRIRDIANNLLAKNRNQNAEVFESSAEEKIETILLSSLIDGLVSEKRMQFRSKLGLQIHFDLNQESYGLFSKIESRELKRVLSNLINNSVEAFDGDGIIKVTLKSSDDRVEIKIIDNGKGIPPEVLLKLGGKGESFGKNEGNGLGLFHARTTLESWGGSLKLESTLGAGTTVTVALSKASAPSWFIRGLKLNELSRVVVIDDDSSIHQIWNGRFESAQFNKHQIEVVHLSNPALAKEWFYEHKEKRTTLYLVDYEFIGSDSNGLKLIFDLGIEKEAILVTSRYEEEHILKKCLENSICLIPKNLSAFVPIEVTNNLVTTHAKSPNCSIPKSEQYQYVYIEDDQYIRRGWERASKRKSIRLLTLESTKEFKSHIEKMDKETTLIYIDSNLGPDDMAGEDFAKILHDDGFKNLFIATGYEKERFAHLPWLKHAGKDCPFDE